jgi:hypothetical protein
MPAESIQDFMVAANQKTAIAEKHLRLFAAGLQAITDGIAREGNLLPALRKQRLSLSFNNHVGFNETLETGSGRADLYIQRSRLGGLLKKTNPLLCIKAAYDPRAGGLRLCWQYTLDKNQWPQPAEFKDMGKAENCAALNKEIARRVDGYLRFSKDVSSYDDRRFF